MTNGVDSNMFNYEVIQSLNELELSLYSYIMMNRKKVMYMRIRELADEAHVSTTTILRFCKKLKCEGFSEFKVRFKMYIEEENIKGNLPDLNDKECRTIECLTTGYAFQTDVDKARYQIQMRITYFQEKKEGVKWSIID